MLARFALLLLVFCFGCSTDKSNDPLAGTYVGWMFIDGNALPSDGSMGTSEKLVLRSDGTYTYELKTSVMMQLTATATGSYARAGDGIKLKGKLKSTMDDGYRKETTTKSYNENLKLENGMLVKVDGKGDPYYYRKEGSGPPPLPEQLQIKESDKSATAVIQRLEKVYGALKSFKTTGTVKSKGGGFVAEDARFKFLFKSPSQFRFEASILDGSTVADRVEITWDGGEKCWWYSTEYDETTDRSLGNALSIASVTFGPEASLIPSLLLPKEIQTGGLTELYPEATLLPNETINGRNCTVVQLKSPGADKTKLWIDKKYNMILRLYEELRDVTVSFDPHPNVEIESKELMLGKRSPTAK